MLENMQQSMAGAGRVMAILDAPEEIKDKPDAVTLENVRVAFARDAEPGIPAMRSFIEPVCRMGFYFDNVGAVTLRNVALEGAEGSAVIAKHCGRVDAPGFSV